MQEQAALDEESAEGTLGAHSLTRGALSPEATDKVMQSNPLPVEIKQEPAKNKLARISKK